MQSMMMMLTDTLFEQVLQGWSIFLRHELVDLFEQKLNDNTPVQFMPFASLPA